MNRVIKKIWLLFVICVLVFITSGCGNQKIEKSVSADNFSKYEAALLDISNQHNLSMNEMEYPDSYDDGEVRKSYEILDKDNLIINVYMYNSAVDNERYGEEKFDMYYKVPESEEFNINLFLQIVNSISGQTISKEYCEQFLSDINVKDDSTRDADVLFRKEKSLNFWEDWKITYTLFDDNMQELNFYGFTVSCI